MSLSVSFRVVGMRADESMEHTITIMEQRRPLPHLVPQDVPRGPSRPIDSRQESVSPPTIINVPVTPDQFALIRIGQTLELDMGLPGQKQAAEGSGGSLPDALRQFRELQR